MFSTMNNLLSTLQLPSDTQTQNAQFSTEMRQALKQIDNSLERISDGR